MEAKLQKWGNSVGVRIPINLLKSVNFKENDIIDIVESDGKIIISKSNKRKISLKKLFEDYHGTEKVEPFDWGEPRGREIW
jgi:antitoxin MazE